MYRHHHLYVICNNLMDTEQFFSVVLGTKLIERRKFGTEEGSLVDLNGTIISLRRRCEDDDIVGDSTKKRL